MGDNIVTERKQHNIHWQARDTARTQRQEAKLKIVGLDQEISSLRDKMGVASAEIRRLLGLRSVIENEAKAAELREMLGAGWTRATGLFAKKLVDLGQRSAKQNVSVTVTELERDPTALKTSERLRQELEASGGDIETLRRQISGWASAIRQLASERDALSEQAAAHTSAMFRLARQGIKVDAASKVTGAIHTVQSATDQVSQFTGDRYRGMRNSFFAKIGTFAQKTVDWAAARQGPAKTEGVSSVQGVIDAARSVLADVPVPVPVPAELAGERRVPVLRAEEILTRSVQTMRALGKRGSLAAEDTGLPLIDARRLYELPEPTTGRDWVCMIAGFDYTAIKAEPQLASEYTKALRAMGVPIGHERRMLKHVKQQITQLFGLKEGADFEAIRLAVDRRIALGVDRFMNAEAFAQRLLELGVAPDASPRNIAEAVAQKDRPDIGRLTEEMNASWPKGQEVAPEKFTAIAAQLDALKKQRFDALGSRPSMGAVQDVLADAETMHGKARQSTNAANTAIIFLGDADVAAHLGTIDPERIAHAVRWLNLGDMTTPVGVLAAKRKLTAEENEAWVKPRPERAAELFRKFGLGDEATAQMIANHRGADRSKNAILIDLMDQLAALGAKPFFQTEGKPDAEKIFKVIKEDGEKAHVPEVVLSAIESGLKRGLLAEAFSYTRPDDLYIRLNGAQS